MLRQLNDIIIYIYKVLVGLLLLLCPCDGWAQTACQLPVSTGMRTNYVRSLLQDKYGYVWMATTSGLGRYDGYQMEFIKPTRKGNRQLLQDTRILDIKYWRNRFVWIRTRGNKYSCYDIDRESFVDYTGNGMFGVPYRGYAFLRNGNLLLWNEKNIQDISFDGKNFKAHSLDFPASSSTQDVVSYHDTPKGGFLVMADGRLYRRRGDRLTLEHAAYLSKSVRKVTNAAYHQGILYLSTNDGVYEYHVDARKMQLSSYNPRQAVVLADNRGNVVILSLDGSDVYYLTSRQTYHFKGIYNARLLQLDSEPRYTFNTSSSGVLWITTYGNGVHSFNPSTGELKSYADLLPSPYVLAAFEDKEGNLWTSMENMGVSIVDTRNDTNHYIYPGLAGQVSHANDVRLLKVLDNIVFVADRMNGLYVADGRLGNLRPYQSFGDDVTAVEKDAQGHLWIGTRKKGIFVDGKPLGLANENKNANTDKISDFLTDKKGRMWIAVFGKGLYVYEKGKQTHVLTDKLLHLRNMTMDKDGHIYLCSDKGVLYFNPDRLLRNPKDYQVIRALSREESAYVCQWGCAYVDSKQRVWLGSVGNGLRMIHGKDTLDFTTRNGLDDNNVKSVIEDKATGDIWIGTEHGVSRWKNGKFTNYYFGDNELSNLCTENNAVCLSDGRIAFATHQGILTFLPSRIVERKSPFSLAITKMEVNGVSVNELEDSVGLDQALVKTKEVTLNHNQNSLTFYFSDFSYSRKEGSTFSCYLEGYEKTWSGLSHLNFAQYRNLPSGKYKLHVRSCNANGVWSPEEAMLTIVVRPPFYATWWAYLVYVVLLGVALAVVYRTLKRMNDLRTAVKVENQLTEYKLRFFTNISHEFRTPLSIIQGNMERMNTIGDVSGELREPLASMSKSVSRMTRLVNQLLEFRKMQNDKLKLALEKTDVIAFLREIFFNFKSQAKVKNINYLFLPFDRSYEMYVDRNYLDKIAYNLLSNALKYTPSRGEVVLRVSLDKSEKLVVSVEDSGIGVEKDKQPHLFERFNRSSYAHDSIGIGLHLTAELVRVHHGAISYRENQPQGSIFRVELPSDEKLYQPSDYMSEDNVLILEDEKKTSGQDYKSVKPVPMNDFEVMVVDDDNDVREFLVSELSRYFHIVSACDGQEALEKMQAKKPNLVVSDVLMPRMDGFRLVKSIREDKDLSDVPVILLTALTEDKKQLTAMDVGADAYVEKPFSLELLVGRCCQLLNQRRLLKMMYCNQPNDDGKPSKMVLPEIRKDEKNVKFQQVLDTWLVGHLSDENLSVDTLAESMGYARTNFYKKIKEATGCTPNEYIRMFRMNRAVELLQEGKLTVSEISYQVGFTDPNYFSKVFKSFYGVTPSKYKEGK